MFGCLRRLGCLAVLAIAAALYVTRDTWRPLAGRLGPRQRRAVTPDTGAVWQSVDQASAARGERAVRALSTRRGPVYVNVRPGELASYAFLSLADALPASLRGAQTTVRGDRVYVRTVVSPADFAGVLGGPVRRVLQARDTLQFGGTFDVLRPGLAQFNVADVRIGAVPIPAALVPRVVARFRQGPTPAGVVSSAIAVPLPAYIGDVRVGRGRITLYKAAP
ncbi:hypothetical protein tb265_00910 [Gemmatimonadetes bacterium T265]|nr:hypothetical protein tb265_00910 [Gemmatimonadetes bacterium T265]